LDNDDVNYLSQIASSASWDPVYQYFNIFHADIYVPYSENLDVITQKFYNLLQLNEDYKVLKYFLRYNPGSFARVHRDHSTVYTIITPLDTENLVGGETLVYDTYTPPTEGRDPRFICKRSEKENDEPPYGQNIVPRILPMSDGESLIYGPNLFHAVAQVQQGSRLVYITWFQKK
jgi:hypothetical protein